MRNRVPLVALVLGAGLAAAFALAGPARAEPG
jgi:hypothetical protein